jgi:glycosyltransferase involved in cell wall biosynthesis
MKKFDQPLVSIMALCHNHEKFVIDALNSVLNQTYKNIELFIIDDNSSDASQSVIENWIKANNVDCTFIKHEVNHSICYSYNEFLALAKGTFISSLSTDDLYELDKIEKQLEIFNAISDNYGVVYNDMLVIDGDNNVTQQSFYKWYLKGEHPKTGNMISEYIKLNPVHVLGALIKREVYDKTGAYDPSLAFEDWDMGFRWATVTDFYYHPHIVSRYRKFSGQMTDKYWNDEQKYLKVLETTFSMYYKHLGLKDYRSEILSKLVDIHHQFVFNKHASYSRQLEYCRKIFLAKFSFNYLFLLFFSLLGEAKLYFRVKNKIFKLARA